jgi:hypothetical protein
VTFSGSRYLAAWLDDASDELQAVRLDANGASVDTTPIALGKHADASALHLAGDGENVLVAVTDPDGVRARRVRMADGAVLPDPELVLTADHDASALAFDGERYLLASRRPVVAGTSYQFRITRVSRAGTLVDATPIDVVTRTDSPGYELGLSPGAGGKALVVYDVFDNIGGATSRARAHLLSDPPPPPPPPPLLDAAAPDAALSPDAGTPDTLEPDGTATGGPVDGGAPVADSGAGNGSPDDGGTATSDAITADGGTGPAADAAVDGRTAPTAADAAADGGTAPAADASSAADGAIPVAAPDAAAERPGSGKHAGGCQLGGHPRPGASLAFMALALIARLRRRRRVA